MNCLFIQKNGKNFCSLYETTFDQTVSVGLITRALTETETIFLCFVLLVNGALMVPMFIPTLVRFVLILVWIGGLYIATVAFSKVHIERRFWMLWQRQSLATNHSGNYWKEHITVLQILD